MKATISPHLASGSIIQFEIHQNDYYSGKKRVSKQMTVDETAVIYDFGYCSSDSTINLTDIELTKTQADRLIEMQQSTTCASYYYSNGYNVYNTKLDQVKIKPYQNNKFKADITLMVVEKIV